jgi:hypothetical protein
VCQAAAFPFLHCEDEGNAVEKVTLHSRWDLPAILVAVSFLKQNVYLTPVKTINSNWT